MDKQLQALQNDLNSLAQRADQEAYYFRGVTKMIETIAEIQQAAPVKSSLFQNEAQQI